MGLDQDRRRGETAGLQQPVRWVLPAAAALLSLLLEAGGESWRELLRYDREGLVAGDGWRLLSGHFVHLGWSHWFMNVLALAVIWVLVGDRLSPRRWLLVWLLVIAGIDAGFWWLEPGLQWYVGLSGLLHGLLAAGIVAGWQRAPGESLLLAGLLFAKLSWEQVAGPLPGSVAAAGGPVVVDAHLYGALAALPATLLALVSVRRFRSL